MSSCFLAALFKYRESPDRSPREDYLSAVLCELLNQASRELCLLELIGAAFPNSSLPKSGETAIQWSVQYMIASRDARLAGKRPDLVGRGTIDGKRALLLIENKIDAGLQQHRADNGDVSSQLDTYFEYLRGASADLKQIFYISRWGITPVSEIGGDTAAAVRSTSWRRLAQAIGSVTSAGSTPVTAYLGERLRELLEEFGMTEIRITPSSITAYHAWNELRAWCEKLGTEWAWSIWRNHPVALRQSRASFDFTHGKRYGPWGTDNYVCLMTPQEDELAQHAHNSYVFLYAGVLLAGVEEYVEPQHPGLPSLATGIALCLRRDQWLEQRRYLEQLLGRLNSASRSAAPGWKLDVRNGDGNDPRWERTRDWVGINLLRELPFLDALQLWGATWTEEPTQFLTESLDAMESALTDEDFANLHALHRAAASSD